MPTITPDQRRAAKTSLLADLQSGYSVPEAHRRAAIPLHRTTLYRFRQRMQADPVSALEDGRHGHPLKLRGEVRNWLMALCQETPHLPSHLVQAALQEQFGMLVSISQLNRFRAAHGLSSRRREKKQAAASLAEEPPLEPAWQEGAGGLLLLAAAHETGLIKTLEAALPLTSPACPARLVHSTRASRERLLLTLLFLNAVGLRRTADLRGYTGNALALLTTRPHAYGYRHTERFLAQAARGGADEGLTQALARWTASLWRPQAPVFYLDGHKKPVYADVLLPRGLIGRTGKVLGCRALLLLHDQQGHPLVVTTQRGDTHLTSGLPAILAVYEQAADLERCQRLVVDREGMAAAFLAALAGEGREVVTILRTDQYTGLESFREVGDFVPLQADRDGQVVREVALARFDLPLPDQPGQVLELRVALIRDWRRLVPQAPSSAEERLPLRWDEHPDGTLEDWTHEHWQATPLPSSPREPKLIPIVTTALEADAVELVQTYIRRWPAQENVIRDWL